jgi:hypothetical protein
VNGCVPASLWVHAGVPLVSDGRQSELAVGGDQRRLGTTLLCGMLADAHYSSLHDTTGDMVKAGHILVGVGAALLLHAGFSAIHCA